MTSLSICFETGPPSTVLPFLPSFVTERRAGRGPHILTFGNSFPVWDHQKLSRLDPKVQTVRSRPKLRTGSLHSPTPLSESALESRRTLSLKSWVYNYPGTTKDLPREFPFGGRDTEPKKCSFYSDYGKRELKSS